MFENIETIRMARAMTGHAAERQKVVARNIANSDTPGFRAMDMPDFASSYREAARPADLRGTHPRHITTASWSPAAAQVFAGDSGISPNGNSVSLEDEMLKLAEVRRDHDLSIGIYRSALNLMRTGIGRRN